MIKIEKLQEVTDEMWEDVNDFNKEIVEEFLQQSHLSKQTLKQYRSGLMQFFVWVKDNCSNKPLHKLKPRDALRYQNFLINRGLSSSAVKFKRSSVSSLCGYLEVYFLDEYPTFRNIYNKNIPNPPSAKKREKVPLTKDEIMHLMKELEKRGKIQECCYVAFTYISGCRRAESRQLLREVVKYDKAKNRDGEERNYYITNKIRAKGRGEIGKVRTFMFDEWVMKYFKKWETIREDDSPYMFVAKGKNGVWNQVSLNTFNYWCSNVFSKILDKEIFPHLFRSSRATNLALDEGKDINKIKDLLGHQDVSTTEIYIVRDNSDDMDDLF